MSLSFNPVLLPTHKNNGGLGNTGEGNIWQVFMTSAVPIAVKCREAVSSEVKSLKWSEKLSNVEHSEVQ